MKRTVMIALFLLSAGCGAGIDERYQTLQQAQSDGVFRRKWLPRMVPASTRQIEIRGDRELEILVGEFQVSRDEFDPFVSHFQEYSAEPLGADVHLAAYLHSKKVEGLIAGVYYEDDIMWRFVCNRSKLECSYQKCERLRR